jgi:DNA-binding SARP family transcriptional activator
VQFRLLGPLEVLHDDKALALGGAKQRVVLAQLLLRPNALVPADRLADAVWDDNPPAAARNVLQTYVSRLRKLLGAWPLEESWSRSLTERIDRGSGVLDEHGARVEQVEALSLRVLL